MNSKQQKTIVCLGDSITCNWEGKTYPDFWQEMIDKAKLPYQIINAGINGETVQDGYYRLDRDVISHRPDLVTIMFGHNEIGRGLSINHYEQYINLIVGKIRQLLPKIRIWVMTPNKINSREREPLYGAFLKILRQKDDRFELVDIWLAFEKEDLDTIYTYRFDYNGLTGSDWIHPNEKGQKLIAKVLMEKMQTDN